jgi:hypothetical protein
LIYASPWLTLITPEFAKLMVRSGVGDLEVAITSGSQEALNNLHIGFRLERLYDGCRYLVEAVSGIGITVSDFMPPCSRDTLHSRLGRCYHLFLC